MFSAFQRLFEINRLSPEAKEVEARIYKEDLNSIQILFKRGRSYRNVPVEEILDWLGLNVLSQPFLNVFADCISTKTDIGRQVTYSDFIMAFNNWESLSRRLMESDSEQFVYTCLTWRYLDCELEIQGLGNTARVLGSVRFLEKFPEFRNCVRSMLRGFSDKERRKATLPVLLNHNHKSLLTRTWAWILSFDLKPAWKREWELIYSSEKDGMGFQTCLSRVRGRGVTIMIVRDENGFVFGGLAPAPWEPNGRFYGESTGFIFSLHPTFDVYKPKGSNGNYQWCGEKFTQLPNGFGFGGQVGFFSVFIDASFDSGMSVETNTYAAPTLSSSQKFKPIEIEFWLVERSEDDVVKDLPGGSVLDRLPNSNTMILVEIYSLRFKEDREVLGLMGKATHSLGYRDEGPIDD